MTTRRITARERDTVIQALRAGVVPRTGLQHVQVGRAREVQEASRDMERIADGGSAVRFVIGPYGSGKSFFLTLARWLATTSRLVTMHADLTPDRRLHSSGDEARLLCSGLVQSLATRTKPEGGALQSIVERFIDEARKGAGATGNTVDAEIRCRLESVRDLVGGYDFADVVVRYWRSFDEGDEDAKTAALRWLRADYRVKTEAKQALGVRSIVESSNIYDHLKAIARLARLAGYHGTLVVIDEMVNLSNMASGTARKSNYEMILRIVNDTLQGSAENLGWYFGGTPEFLSHTRRGLYSYEALQSRLAENAFARDGVVDFSGPVMRLAPLTKEEVYVLLDKLRVLWGGGQGAEPVPEEAVPAFLDHCHKKIGEAYFQTPRNTIRAFLDMLAVIDQNPAISWRDLIGQVEIAPDREGPARASPSDAVDAPTPTPGTGSSLTTPDSDDELMTFTL